MSGLEFVSVYIDDLLCITTSTFEDHLDKLTEVLAYIQTAGLNNNATKSFFAKSELEYLGFWVTREDIQPLQKKIDAILAIAIPTNQRPWHDQLL